MIYLDNAATTAQKPDCVIEATTQALKFMSVNAGRGGYDIAREATSRIEKCKDSLLALLGISSQYHVYFSPSNTVSMNGLILGLNCDEFTTIYVSPFEHNAVMRPLEAVHNRTGCNVKVLPFNTSDWALDEDEVTSMFIKNKPDFIFVSLISNTTGFVLPVEQIVEIGHQYGAKVIVDCAQAMGTYPFDYSAVNADAYVFAGHKTLYAPFGIAGAIIRDSWQLDFGVYGGTGSDSLNMNMPAPEAGGYEPGSPNVPAICGLQAAIDWIQDTSTKVIWDHETRLVNLLLNELRKNEKIILYAPPADRIGNLLAINVKGYESREVGEILNDEFDICVRTGYQCAPLVHDWLRTKEYAGIVRLSVSYFTTEDDIKHVIEALNTL